jgi:hypothetical protein
MDISVLKKIIEKQIICLDKVYEYYLCYILLQDCLNIYIIITNIFIICHEVAIIQ